MNAKIQSQQISQPSEEFSILVVDDDIASLTILRCIFERHNFSVTTASNGKEALELINSRAFSAVVLDANMPVINGFDTCKQIRDIFSKEELFIIMATGYDDEFSINRAFDVGANDYITKPFDQSILAARLKAFLSQQESYLDLKHRNTLNILNQAFDVVLPLSSNFQLINHQVKNEDADKLNNLLDLGLEELQKLLDRAFYSSIDLRKKPEYYLTQPFDLHNGHNKLPMHTARIIKLCNYRLALILSEVPITNSSKVEETTTYFNSQTLLPGSFFYSQYLARTTKDNFALIDFKITNQNEGVPDGQTLVFEPAEYLAKAILEITAKCSSEYTLYQPYNNKLVLSIENISRNDYFQCIKSFFSAISEAWNDSPYGDSHNVSCASIHGTESKLAASSIPTLLSKLMKEKSFSYLHDMNAIKTIEDSITRKSLIKSLLKRDLKSHLLDAYFQPKFHISDNSLCGMEALARWNNEQLGSISPGEFIPLIKELGLMDELTKLIIVKTVDVIDKIRSSGYKPVPISINFDGDSLLNFELIEFLLDICSHRMIDPSLIQIEVTESVMVDQTSSAINNLQALRNRKFSVAMDDFGTGYSTFSYLKALPLDTLKIDRSFISGIAVDLPSFEIVRAIVDLGHSLNLHVIAEGVECNQQLELLKQLKCDSVQGFLTGKPEPSVQLLSWNLQRS